MSDKKTKELRYIADDEKGNISINTIDDNIVLCNLTAKANADDPNRVQMTWKFDFSNCSESEVQEIAANYLKIRMQDAWRKSQDYKDASVWDNAVFDVKEDILNKKRISTANPLQKAKKLAAKLSPEEREELLQELAA